MDVKDVLDEMDVKNVKNEMNVPNEMNGLNARGRGSRFGFRFISGVRAKTTIL